ncbi:MAG: threonine synthase, partial [Flavobacteriaceae bacterium]|nr:threonine synthase [Flavobacteriaceae bacterium]
ELHDHDIEKLRKNLSGFSYSDAETTEALHNLYHSVNYIADPHGAIGYLALKAYLQDKSGVYGVFLETAHPIKFLPVMPKAIAERIELPQQIKAIINKEKHSIAISNYEQLKDYLLKNQTR